MPTKQYIKKLNGYYVKDEEARTLIENLSVATESGKVDRFVITNQTEEEVQRIFSITRPKVIEFANDYTFTATRRLTANTTILLNNHTLTFDIPTISEDYTASHGFFNFESNDEFTEYNGNGNIEICGGKIIGGNCSFCHAHNIRIKNVVFENCKNDHVFELAAIDGAIIQDCIFAGTAAAAVDKEMVQLDHMLYGNFPWLEENSVTYDNTPNKNIRVIGCEFRNSETEGYRFTKAFGMHTYSADSIFDGIEVIGCKFEDVEFVSIELRGVKNVRILDNNFIKTTPASDPEGAHIRIRETAEHILINNNIFEGNVRAIETASPQLRREDVAISENVFRSYFNTGSAAAHCIIQVGNTNNIRISNNTFEDFTQRAIQLAEGTAESPSSLMCFIENNSFRPKANDPQAIIQIYAGTVHINGNTFDTAGITMNRQCVLDYDTENIGKIYAENNIFSNDLASSRRTIFVRDFTEVFGISRIAFSPSEDTYRLDEQTMSDGLDYSQFNTIIFGVNNGASQTNIRIRSNDNSSKLVTYRYVIPAVLNDGTIGVITIILNVDTHKISFSSTDSSIKVTRVILANER